MHDDSVAWPAAANYSTLREKPRGAVSEHVIRQSPLPRDNHVGPIASTSPALPRARRVDETRAEGRSAVPRTPGQDIAAVAAIRRREVNV
jgi:hypothetical protein